MNSLTTLGYAHVISDSFTCRHEKLYIPPCSLTSNGSQLEQVVNTHRTPRSRAGWPTGVGELNPSPLSWISTSGSAPLLYLFTSATVLTPVHITPKSGTETIRYVTLNLRDQPGAASPPYKKRAEIAFLTCGQKPYISGMNFVPAWKLFCIMRT